MRRIAALLFVLALVGAACGDDDTGTTEATTATTSGTTPTTAAPATTTAPETTTTEAANEALEAALDLVGTYEGEWNNTTFGSSGPIEITVEVDEATGIATMVLDLGGSVFGLSDPDPIEYTVDLSSDPDAIEVTDELFGDSLFEGDGEGGFTFESDAVAGLGGLSFLIEGTIVDGEFAGTYTIPTLAEGTFELAATG